MKVKMKVPITGTRNGKQWPEVGGTIVLPDQEGANMCAQGLCEPVAEKPAKRTETRTTKSKG